jgi:hypothetical protein
MTTATSPRRFAMSLSWCFRMGTAMAADGWTRNRVMAYLELGGYGERGLTARRVLRAYNEQLARG